MSDTALCRQCRHMRRDGAELWCAALGITCRDARQSACEHGEFFEEKPDTWRMRS
jgi:hypothetical protein